MARVGRHLGGCGLRHVVGGRLSRTLEPLVSGVQRLLRVRDMHARDGVRMVLRVGRNGQLRIGTGRVHHERVRLDVGSERLPCIGGRRRGRADRRCRGRAGRGRRGGEHGANHGFGGGHGTGRRRRRWFRASPRFRRGRELRCRRGGRMRAERRFVLRPRPTVRVHVHESRSRGFGHTGPPTVGRLHGGFGSDSIGCLVLLLHEFRKRLDGEPVVSVVEVARKSLAHECGLPGCLSSSPHSHAQGAETVF